MTRDEIIKVEEIANSMVRANYPGKIMEHVSMKKAKAMGAMALFGEKYGENVRVVQFGDSTELCGGTHVASTGSIGIIKIISEGAIASGIRRIEAVTAEKADEYINGKLIQSEEVATLLKSTGSIKESVEKLIAENNSLRKTIEKFQAQSAKAALKELEENGVDIKGIKFISGKIETDSVDTLKAIAFELRSSSENIVAVIGSAIGDKANIVVMVSDSLVREKNINAVNIIKEISAEINGGGGGQPFLAAAGGKKPEGIKNAIARAAEYLKNLP
jgi:alanyl-tRNA synthetase